MMKWLALAFVVSLGGGAVADEDGSTFEALQKNATPLVAVGDWEQLVEELTGTCDGLPELETRQCNVMRAWHQRELRAAKYTSYGDAGAVRISPGTDRTHRRVEVLGCLFCKDRVTLRKDTPQEQKFFIGRVALDAKKKPIATSLLVKSDDYAVAEDVVDKWDAEIAPRLRAQFVFTLAERFQMGSAEALDVKLLGSRVIDACTGAVLWSDPPSVQTAPRVPGVVCPKDTDPEEIAKRKLRLYEARPARLDRDQIETTMNEIRQPLRSCVVAHATLPLTVTAHLTLTSGGDVENVVVAPPLQTPAGDAIAECASTLFHALRFASFRDERQSIDYSFVLR